MKGSGNAIMSEKIGITDARTTYNFKGILEAKTKVERIKKRIPENIIFSKTTAQTIIDTRERSLTLGSNRWMTDFISVVLSVSRVSLKKVNNSSIPIGFLKDEPPNLGSKQPPTNTGLGPDSRKMAL